MVRQLINANGNPAANQFVISTASAVYFQSYNSVVCRVDAHGVTLSANWDYSRTTAKHLYIFLQQRGYGHLCNCNEVRKAIKSGEVILVNVPSLPM